MQCWQGQAHRVHCRSRQPAGQRRDACHRLTSGHVCNMTVLHAGLLVTSPVAHDLAQQRPPLAHCLHALFSKVATQSKPTGSVHALTDEQRRKQYHMASYCAGMPDISSQTWSPADFKNLSQAVPAAPKVLLLLCSQLCLFAEGVAAHTFLPQVASQVGTGVLCQSTAKCRATNTAVSWVQESSNGQLQGIQACCRYHTA